MEYLLPVKKFNSSSFMHRTDKDNNILNDDVAILFIYKRLLWINKTTKLESLTADFTFLTTPTNITFAFPFETMAMWRTRSSLHTCVRTMHTKNTADLHITRLQFGIVSAGTVR